MGYINHIIGAVFVPVSDIERSRDWYVNLLDLADSYEILFGHICTIPLTNGTNLVLDSKIFKDNVKKDYPLFHFNTDNIELAFESVKSKEVEVVTEIEHNHYFNVKDLDGNMIMICKC